MSANRAGPPHGSLRRTWPLLAVTMLMTACGEVSAQRPAATPGTAAVATESASAPATPSAVPCPESGITVVPETVNAAMGLRALTLVLTNCGRATFTLHGYPAAEVLDADRRILDVKVGEGASTIASVDSLKGPPRPVRLKRGDRAVTVVLWRNTYTDISKPPVKGVHLTIGPAPGLGEYTVTPEGGLDLGSTGKIGVTPWKRPKTGSARPPANPSPIPSPTATGNDDAK